MTAAILKCLGIVFMTMDHIGTTGFPESKWLPLVGRLAFPIFCFFLAEGCAYTRSRRRYFLRLLIFAILSEVPFQLAVQGRMGFYGQNVLFTLLLGGIAVVLWETSDGGRRWWNLLGLAGICLLAEGLGTDYASFGVLLVLIFYVFSGDFPRQAGVAAFLTVGYVTFGRMGVIELAAIAALLLLKQYNGRRGPAMKYLFYAFYPAHLLVLWGISRVLG